MEFKQFSNLVSNQFQNMQKTDNKLFRSSVTGDKLWDIYIKSFKPKDNPIFRDPNSSSHNDNLDNKFITRYGNVVTIVDNKIVTMWDLNLDLDCEYYLSAKAMSDYLKSQPIEDVFYETFNELNSLPYEKCNKSQPTYKLGIEKNYKIYTQEEAKKFGVVTPGTTYEFYHFNAILDNTFVDTTGKSAASIIGEFRDAKNVFKRGLDEISEDTLKLVIDLINQNSLLDGTSHLKKVETFLNKKSEYNKLSSIEKDNWCWVNSYRLPFAKFKNELIGVLCSELSEGKELNEACLSWNKRVDPANYMKASAPITKRQIEEAKKFVEENNYGSSFNRRFATLKDINVEEILHSNVGNNTIKTASIFDSVKPATSTQHKRSEFDKVEEVTIDKFMSNILPTCTSIEVLVENSMDGNFVALTTSNDKQSKPLFKWNNNFSWTFNGNLAGKSQIKENVKAVGGKITGILRCSLQWNDDETKGIIDFDLHCKTPFTEIYFSNRNDSVSKGWLDVDMVNPPGVGIENITWQNTLKDGVYKFFVRNYSGHTNHKGFKAEIEFNGNVFNYHYSQAYKGDMNVATVTVKNGVMTIKHHLPESSSNKTIWNLETNQFHRVNLVCTSPNHWGDNNIGNKHYLFMLDNCKSDIPLRSFHNENLTSDLLQHRKVMEVLGNTTMLEPATEQLCGLGFNSTVKDELILKLNGSHKRTIKVKF
jgi:hypothetical protein